MYQLVEGAECGASDGEEQQQNDEMDALRFRDGPFGFVAHEQQATD